MRTVSDRDEKGFTLIETLVATMILAIGVVTILQLFSGGLQSITASENYTRAIFHVKEKMNEILLAESLAEGTVEGVFDDGYQWRTNLSVIKDGTEHVSLPVTRFSVYVIVEWKQGIKKKQVEMSSITLAKLIPEES